MNKIYIKAFMLLGFMLAMHGNTYAAINPAGGSWAVVGSGTSGAKYDSIVVDPFNANNIYAVRSSTSTSGGATLKSGDGGATWNTWAFNFQGQALPVGSFTLEPVNKTILLTSGTRLFVTQDGGTTWAEIGAGLENDIIRNSSGIIHIHQYNSSNANGVRFSNIRKSADGGMTWVTLGSRPANFPMGDYFIDDTTGTWYRYGSSVLVTDANGAVTSWGVSGIQKSLDTGATWADLTTSATIATADIVGFWVESKTGNLLAMPDSGWYKDLYMSTDGGSTWQMSDAGADKFSKINSTHPDGTSSFFHEDPFNSGNLYFFASSVSGASSLVSTDGGVTWSSVNMANGWSCRGVSPATDNSGVIHCGSSNGNNFLGSALIKFTPTSGVPTPTTTTPSGSTPTSTTAAEAGGGCLAPTMNNQTTWLLLILSTMLIGITALKRQKK